MSEYVTQGAVLECTCGEVPSKLKVTGNNLLSVQGKMVATTSDKAPMINIMPFGKCKMKPIITGFAPCVPVPIAWSGFVPSVQIPGGNPLLKTSTIQCACGGTIQFRNSGQMKPEKLVVNPYSPQIEALKKAAMQATPFCEECAKKKHKEKRILAIDVYWMDEESDKRHYNIFPDYEVNLYIETVDYNPGEILTLDIFPEKGRKFKGGKDKTTIRGTVDAYGLVCIQNFKVEYEKNG